MKRHLAYGLLALAATSNLMAEPLERLFFSREQRQTLETMRRFNMSQPFTVDGEIRKNDTLRILWLNGKRENKVDGERPGKIGHRIDPDLDRSRQPEIRHEK